MKSWIAAAKVIDVSAWDNASYTVQFNAGNYEGMLALLSGTTHQVLTAVALQSGARRDAALSVSQVRFASMTPGQIAHYVASGEPMGKAGAYAIQGRGAALVDWNEVPTRNEFLIFQDYFRRQGMTCSIVDPRQVDYLGAQVPTAHLISHIHRTAPGPPAETAVATPTMLPVPMVAASAVVSASRSNDTVAPARPSGLTAKGSASGITLDWANNTETDLEITTTLPPEFPPLSHFTITGTPTAGPPRTASNAATVDALLARVANLSAA